MSLSQHLSEEELRALLEQARQDGQEPIQEIKENNVYLPAEAALNDVQERELLQAMKDVIRTLTVRVASLESEVGRLRSELTALQHGPEQLPPAGERIVIGETKHDVPQALSGMEHVDAEVAAAALTSGESETEPGSSEGLTEDPPESSDASPSQALIPRASRYRKRKKGFFSKWFRS